MEQALTRNVLVGVDIQNDFITGSLAVNDGAAVIEPTNQVAQLIRSSGGDVAFTRDWHPGETPHFGTWPVHCVAGTEGAAFAPTLEIAPTDVIVSKGMEQTDGYSGVEGIGPDGETLESLIMPRAARERVRVLLSGLALDYCVKATGLDLAEMFKDDERVQLYLLREATRGVELQTGDSETALKELTTAQVLAISTEEALAMIKGIR